MQTNQDKTALVTQEKPTSALEFAKDSEALQMILDRWLGFVCTIDRTGLFVDVSKECEVVCGYQHADLIGKSCFDFIVEDDRERTRAEFAAVMYGTEVVDCENRFRHASAEIIDLRWSVRWDSQNDLMCCVVHNITESRHTQRALHQTAQNYRTLFHSSPLPKWIYDKSTHQIVEVNKKAVSHYGFTSKEFLEKKITDLLPADEVPKSLDASIDIEVGSEAVYVGKFTHVKSSGELMRVELYCHGSQFNNSDCITVTSIDISEREYALAQLQESIQRYEFVTKATYDVVWDWDLADNRMYRGEGVYALFGYASEQLTPDFNAWEKYVHPDDRERVEAGIRFAMHNENNIWRDEYRFKRSDGTYVLILDRGLVIRDDSGKAIRMVGAMQDITRQRDEEQRLRLLESVITNTNDAVIITKAFPLEEPGPAIVYVNDAFTRMTGYDASEVIGKSPRFLQGPNSNTEMLHALSEAMRQFQTFEVETINYKKNGEEFWINFSVSPVSDHNGDFTHFIAIERDVTERKQMELKSALLADIAAIFDKSLSLSETLSEALGRLSQFGDFDLAEAWLVDSDKGRIVLSGYSVQSEAMAEFYRSTTDKVSFEKGVGVPGITWDKEEIQIKRVGSKVGGPTRIDACRAAGLTTVYGLPLRHHKETIGVLLLGSIAVRDSKKKLNDFLAGFEEQFCAEIQRKQFEEELQLLFKFAPAIICIVGTDGYYRRVNPLMCNILGYSESELLSNLAVAFVHPDDRQRTIEELDSLRTRTTDHYFENRHITKSSEVKWLGWTVSPAKEGGNIFAVAKDITERKTLENLLRTSTNMARVGSWELDLVKGKLWWSAMCREIHEVDDAFEPQVGTALSYYAEEDLPVITDLVDRCVRTGEP
ncbi:MAG: PAS domain S-box protein, partial [Candidatus Kapabacteria bacterium]|nr:PAS domain S-box protein [Candidatus Kapabacteria bacterium]